MQMRENSTTTKRQFESLIWSQLGMAGTEFYFFIDCANVEVYTFNYHLRNE